MSQTLMVENYYAGENSDIEGDIQDSILEITDENEIDEYGDYKGYIKVTVHYIPEDGCECTGFQHSTECKHHVMSF
jgi:hypothetical protein